MPETEGDGDDWTMVRVRKRKALGPVEHGQDEQRKFKRQGETEVREDQQSRVKNFQQYEAMVGYGN